MSKETKQEEIKSPKQSDKEKAHELLMIYLAHLGGRAINGK